MTNPITRGLRPIHPGAILREDALPALGLPLLRIAADLRLSRQHLYDILHEKKPVTAQTALKLGRYLGNGPDIWLALQSRYDLKAAEMSMAEALDAIPVAERVPEPA